MTLQQFMDSRGYTKETGSNKACCPFHNDTTYSAYLNPNTIYCFSCSKLYRLSDVYNTFHVSLDRVPEPNRQLNKMQTLSGEETVLFTYNFDLLG